MKKEPKNLESSVRLTVGQTDILSFLGRYRFLTASQLMRLGATNDRSNLNKQLSALRNCDPPLVDSASYGVFPKMGKLESVHCLTAKGRQFLIDELRCPPEEIAVPAAGVQYHKDYFHRHFTIDFQIALDKWAQQSGVEVKFFDVYFDRVKGQKGGERAKTKLDLGEGRYLIADGIFILQTIGYQNHLYCLEVYNGQDLGRTMRQLRQHVEALSLGSASLLYGHDKANRILCVFEEQALLDSVRETLHSDPFFQHVQPFFLLKPLSEIQQFQRFENWVGADGRVKGVMG